ncbi:MAG: hypothetical protein II430_06790, partial [Selenomonas sp.]|nr:hypothetical protein [Selenomonas sp.]
MTWIAKHRKQRIGALTAAIIATVWMPSVMAGVGATEMPTGEHDVSGLNAETDIQRVKDATGNYTGRMDINVSSGKGVINWETFNVGKNAS